MLGLGNTISKASASVLQYVKDNLKLYLDFKSNRSDTLAFPSEGSTSFDGNDEIKIADSNDLQLSTLTISAWIKPNGASEDGYIFSKFDDSTSGGYALNFQGSTDKIRLLSSGVTIGTSDAVFVDDNVWVHIAVTVDGSGNLVYYRNGVASGTASSVTLNTNSLGVVIGNRTGGSSAGHYFNGSMANVAVWSRPLSIEEINSVMNKSYSQLGSVEKTSLKMWHSLDSRSTTGGAKEVVKPSSGEVLGDELVDNLNGTTSGWVAMTGIDLGTSGDYVTATYESGDNVTGIRFYLGATGTGSALSSNVEVGALYKISMTGYITGTTFSYLLSSDVGTRAEGSSWGQGAENVSTKTFYYTPTNASGNIIYPFYEIGSYTSAGVGYVKDVSVKKVLSLSGQVTGATTTTSVYGGNAPILPRAIDITESQAEQIGNGSADFSGSTSDYIALSDRIILKGDFSITGWAYRANAASDMIMSDSTGSETLNYIWITDATKIGIDSPATGWTHLQFNATFDHSEWHHFAITRTAKVFKVYINGALSDTADKSSDSGYDADWSFNQFGRYATGTNYAWGGKLAHIGAFQGALTQSQVQEIYESTSYAKIPADVKSTLGSELAPTSWNGSNATTSESTDYAFSGTTSRKFTTTSTDGYISGSSTFTTTISKVYKLSFMVYSPSDTDIRVKIVQGDGSGWNMDETITIASGAWVSIVRYVLTLGGGASTNIYFQQGTNGVTQYLDDISFKEVTNDLVGFWSLDADNSVPALSFDGVNDVINIPHSSDYKPTTAITVSSWYKPTDHSDWGKIICVPYYSSGWSNPYFSYALSSTDSTSGKPAFGGAFTNSGTYGTVTASTAMNLNEWYHIVGTYDGTSLKIYVNGVLENTTSRTGDIYYPIDANIQIGGRGEYSPGEFTEGHIASVAVYSDAKDVDSILAQYNKGIDADWSSDTNLVGYWKMDNGTTVNDLSSNSNNGAVTGATLIENAVALDSTSNSNDGSLN